MYVNKRKVLRVYLLRDFVYYDNMCRIVLVLNIYRKEFVKKNFLNFIY